MLFYSFLWIRSEARLLMKVSNMTRLTHSTWDIAFFFCALLHLWHMIISRIIVFNETPVTFLQIFLMATTMMAKKCFLDIYLSIKYNIHRYVSQRNKVLLIVTMIWFLWFIFLFKVRLSSATSFVSIIIYSIIQTVYLTFLCFVISMFLHH